jgi:SPP1 gp7 family putative phage head morphogenesis protein
MNGHAGSSRLVTVARRRALDARPETRAERRGFEQVRRAESAYGRGLRSLARMLGDIVNGFGDDLSPDRVSELERMLSSYADLITPWARTQAARMLADVSRRDEAVWNRLSRTMVRELRTEIQQAPTGQIMRELLSAQVHLIRSMPIEAAQRVHHLATEAHVEGRRASEVAAEILRTGEVSRSKANLIARTEVARASSVLVQARAQHVGSDGYVWETARDADVRPSHRKMQSRFVRWDQPPTLDKLTGHAGALPNCRCWPRPIFPEEE